MKALTEKSLAVLNFINECEDDVTVKDIVVRMGMAPADDEEAIKTAAKSVNGTVTALTKKGYAVRVPAQVEVETENGSKYVDIKLVEATEAGKAYDHEAALAQDAADAAAKASKKDEQ